MPSCIETRGELQAPLKYLLGVRVPAQAPRHFCQHAQSRDIGGKGIEVGPQARFGDRQVVLDEGRRGFHQPRILGRGPEVLRPGLIGARGIALRI